MEAEPQRPTAAPPAANPAVRVQSYALKGLSDSPLTRTMTANRRHMLPLHPEVIQVQKNHCLFAA